MSNFRGITGISLTEKHDKMVRKLKASGYFPSLSAVIRYCINYALPKLIKEVREFDDFIEEDNMVDMLKKLKEFGYIIRRGNQPVKKIPIISVLNKGINEVIQ